MRSKYLTVLLVPLLLTGLLSGCGKEKKSSLPTYKSSASPAPTKSATRAPAFTAPKKGDRIGARVAARPVDVQNARGATRFSSWALSLLLHTPREKASTEHWIKAGPTCRPCQQAAQVWQQQAAMGQVFRYAGPPVFGGTSLRAQRRGAGWLVEFDVSVPPSRLLDGTTVKSSSRAERLKYRFSLAWTGGQWQITDLHVLS